MANGLMNGIGKNQFGPNQKMTRAQFVTMLGRMDGIRDHSQKEKSGYVDVNENAYYTAHLIWASKNGIVKGVGKNRFAPEAGISREDMATIVCRYLKYKNKVLKNAPGAVKPFKDAGNISSYAKKSVETLRKVGILKGNNGYVYPKNSFKRTEGAAILARLHKKLK